MKKLAKILVLILSVALVLGALAMVIGAEETKTYSYVGENGDASSDDLAEAIANSTDGMITLTKDLTVDASLVLSDGVMLDLGGHKVENTNAEVALFVINGDVTIGNGTVKSASQHLFNAENGNLTVIGLSGSATLADTGFKGVKELPDPWVGNVEIISTYGEEASTLSTEALYQINHADGSTTYFSTEEEFTKLFTWQTSYANSATYYVLKSGDTVVMNGDITYGTNDVNGKVFNGTANGLTFTLDLNGHTLDLMGNSLIEAWDRDGADRGKSINFTLTSSVPGGTINSAKHNGVGQAEALVSEPVFVVWAANKVINIVGQVGGVDTVSINAGSLWASQGYGGWDCSGTSLNINGGVYSMTAFPVRCQSINASNHENSKNFHSQRLGFIAPATANTYGGQVINNSTVNIDNATIVQAYASYEAPGSLDSGVFNSYYPHLFNFGADSTPAETALSNTKINISNSTVVGRSDSSVIMTSGLTSAQVTYTNCNISANIAPSGSGRVYVTDTDTVFSNCSVAVQEYTEEVVAGVFAPEGYTMLTNAAATSIPLPNAASAIVRDGAIAIHRSWICGHDVSKYQGMYKYDAGYYFIVPNGTDASTFITSDDIANSYTIPDTIGDSVRNPANLVLVLGKATYSMGVYVPPLFDIKSGSTTLYTGYSFADWQTIMTQPEQTYVNGTTITLYDDIVYTSQFEISIYHSYNVNFTLDLNGHTIDTTASGVGFMQFGFEWGRNYKNYFTLKSSVAGGKIKTCPGTSAFRALGATKYITIQGQDAQGNDTLSIETSILFRHQAHNETANFSSFTVNGGSYKQIGSADGFIIMQATGDSGGKSDVTMNFNNASFTSDTDVLSSFVRMYRSGGAEVTDALHGYVNFNNCDIDLLGAQTFMRADTLPSATVTLSNSTLKAKYLRYQNANKDDFGKILVSDGCVFEGAAPKMSEYDASKIASAAVEAEGVYFNAEGLAFAKYNYAIGEEVQNYIVTASENVKYVHYLVNGSSYVEYNDYYKDVVIPAPELTLLDTALGTQSSAGFGADTADGINEVYEATVTTEYKVQPNFRVSATLSSELALNLYIDSQFVEWITDADLKALFVDKGEGVSVATVKVNGNEVFTALYASINFNCEGVTGALYFTGDQTLNFYNYAKKALAAESEAVEKDVVVYMVKYLEAAYTLMGLSDTEIAALGADNLDDARAAAAEKFALISGASASTDYTAIRVAHAGGLGVRIGLDLTSVPRFYIEDGDTVIETVSVNGVELVKDEDDGRFYYSVEAVHVLDVEFSIVINGSVSGKYKLANYLAAAENNGDTEVVNIVEALYKYVLAAKAYK